MHLDRKAEAEVQFLFPAPVSRRALLLHRLLRSQIGILFGVVVFGLTVPSLSGFERLGLGVAMWLLFLTGKVYFTGVSLTRARKIFPSMPWMSTSMLSDSFHWLLRAWAIFARTLLSVL